MADRKKVLLIDDDENFNLLVGLAFKKLQKPVDLLYVNNALKGLQLIKEHEKVPLILLDLRMPVMDGFEFLSELKEQGYDQDTKIIILSSSYRKEDRERAFKSTFVIDYFEKPMQLNKLKELVWHLYENYLKT